jgi:hypothetical protein
LRALECEVWRHVPVNSFNLLLLPILVAPAPWQPPLIGSEALATTLCDVVAYPKGAQLANRGLGFQGDADLCLSVFIGGQ